MPNVESISTIAQMHLVKSVDVTRLATDPFKLPLLLRTQHDTDLDALETADSSTALTEGDRAGGSVAARNALTQLQAYLKEGYNCITAIRASQITDAQRLEVFTEYGWAGGLLGRFNDGRVIALSRLAVQDHPGIQPTFCYPPDLVADLNTQLGIFDANVLVAVGGARSAATHLRDAKLDDAETTLAQVRFFYCSASRDTDQTPELAKIGFQPRRPAGTVTGNSKPTPAPATTTK